MSKIVSRKQNDNTFRQKYKMLLNEYYAILYELALFLNKTDRIGFQKVISNIVELSRRNAININDQLAFWDVMVAAIVEQSDVKSLNTLSYAIQNTVLLYRQDIELNKATRTRGRENLSRILKQEMMSNSKTKRFLAQAANVPLELIDQGVIDTANKSVYILLRSALKGIEQSRNDVVGFLIKFMVANFDESAIRYSLNQLIANSGQEDRSLSRSVLFQNVSVKYHFNEDMLRYCLQKLVLLIFAQQYFLKNLEVSFIDADLDNMVDTTYLDSANITYFIKNIRASRSSISLMLLEDESFLEKLKWEVLRRVESNPSID